MAGAALDVSSFLQRGITYTFSFGAGSLHRSFEEVDAALAFLPNLSSVTARFDHGIVDDRLDVTGVYSGDGSDTVANIIQEIWDALDVSGDSSGNYDFVGVRSGSTGASEGDVNLPGGLKIPTLPSSSSIWAVVLLFALVIFLTSGGSAFLRRVTA